MADQKLTALTLISIAQATDLIYVVTYDADGVTTSVAMAIEDLQQSVVTGVNRIISGQVVWTGTGFTHRSINLSYEINGIIYFSNEEDITNNPPDGSNPRFDVIFVDADGLGIKEGTPAASPTVPSLDNPTDELATNIVLVTNGETTPTDVVLDAAYSENLQESGGEWDTAESTSGVRIDLANTVDPINLTKDIKINTALGDDYFTLSNTTPITIADFQNIRHTFRLLGNWKNDKLRVFFYNGATLVGYSIITRTSFGSNELGIDQDVYIHKGMVSWTVGETQFDEIRYIFMDAGGSTPVSSVKFQLDLIFIEHGSTITVPTSDLSMDVMENMTNAKTTPIDADNLTLWDSVVEQFKQLTWANLKTALAVPFMLKSVYDPTTVEDDAFDMDNMAQESTAKTTPIDADTVSLWDSVGSVFKKVTWANVKATLKTYFDGIYGTGSGDMLAATYDPTTVADDAFDTDNMAEASTGKTTPIDADTVSLFDSVASAFKKLTWANLKATLKTYFDTLYAPVNFDEHLIIEFNPEDTDLAIATGLREFQMPNYATTLFDISVSVTTAPTGSVATFDLNEALTTVLSTKVTIDATEKTSETAATPPVISDSSLAANAVMTIDIDGIGSTIAGKGGKMIIYYRRT